MTENTESDPWEQPPEWVDLPDLPRQLARRFDLNDEGKGLIRKLVEAIRSGILIYRLEGFPSTIGDWRIPAGFDCASDPYRIVVAGWDAVAPDWKTGKVDGHAIRGRWPDAMRWAQMVVPGVQRAQADKPAPARAKRKSNGLDYREADAPVVAEMRNMIDAGDARSPEDAALAVFDRAVGKAIRDSKVKRLARHYREKYPSQQE